MPRTPSPEPRTPNPETCPQPRSSLRSSSRRPHRRRRLRCTWPPLSVQGGRVEIGKPVNISDSPGYDNQPSFTPDGASVLFTSVRPERKPDPANGAAIGSDIYRYDLAGKTISRVTNTPESEYSATVTPDARHISVIRVESDGTQRLWQFTLDGSEPTVLLPRREARRVSRVGRRVPCRAVRSRRAGAAGDVTSGRHEDRSIFGGGDRDRAVDPAHPWQRNQLRLAAGSTSR